MYFFVDSFVKILMKKYTHKLNFTGKFSKNFFLQEITCKFKMIRKLLIKI